MRPNQPEQIAENDVGFWQVNRYALPVLKLLSDEHRLSLVEMLVHRKRLKPYDADLSATELQVKTQVPTSSFFKYIQELQKFGLAVSHSRGLYQASDEAVVYMSALNQYSNITREVSVASVTRQLRDDLMLDQETIELVRARMLRQLATEETNAQES